MRRTPHPKLERAIGLGEADEPGRAAEYEHRLGKLKAKTAEAAEVEAAEVPGSVER